MRGSKTSIRLAIAIALYTISGCSASLSSLLIRHDVGCVGSVFCCTLKSLSSSHYRNGRLRQQQQQHHGENDDASYDNTHNHINFLYHLRGGQQQQQQLPPSGNGDDDDDDSTTGSYHGKYIFPADTESLPPAPSTMALGAAAISTTTTTGIDTTAAVPPSPSPAVLAIATSTNSKLTNLQERTGPAMLMLGAISLLLKYTGKNGLIGLVLAMQLAMYAESTSIVENYYNPKTTNQTSTAVIRGEEKEFISFYLQKWWWFATAIMMTSGRKLLSEYTPFTMDQWNLITLGMTALSLVVAVVQLAMISSTSEAEELYRHFLGKMACCHYSLLLLVGISSFWIKTVEEFGLIWVLFPAFLVVVNDTMAYVFGVLLGKHKLLPRLSPKKTVEGFVGAGLSTFAVATPLLRLMIRTTNSMQLNASRRQHALIMALYVSLISPFGGFLASAVKRAHGAKDFGSLIPGHGGVVDRFDCQVITAPFVYLYLTSCSP